jgi:acetoin:2,6-dichlorophenolindophenol oxidoreductase subunit alpha
MSEQEITERAVDRRSFLKILGAAGATAVMVSACQPTPTPAPTAVPATAVPPTAVPPTKAPVPPTAVPPTVAPTAAPPTAVPATAVPTKPAVASDEDLLAAVPKATLIDIYTRMVRSRKWETTMKDTIVAGKDGLYGAFHCYVGEEAIACTICTMLNKDDFVTSTHRGHGHLIGKGGDLNKMSAEIFFRQGGYNKGFGGSMHITDMSLGILGMNGIVGASWYPAAGAAYAAKLRGTKQVSVAFGGEGASNSPYFFSAVRNAVNYKLPVIFVIENNMYQISIPAKSNIVGGQASQYAKGLGIPCKTVDGNSVAALYGTMKAAVDLARSGGGPSVVEGMTYRWYDHSGFAAAKVGQDGAFGLPYRSDDELKSWMAKDPIPAYIKFLVDRKFATADELKAIDDSVQKLVDASVDFARKSPPPNATDGLKNVYAVDGQIAPNQFFNAVVPTAYKYNPQTPVFGIDLPFTA